MIFKKENTWIPTTSEIFCSQRSLNGTSTLLTLIDELFHEWNHF